jgi:ATP-dependent Lon protease
MDIIAIEGYTDAEKSAIATAHLLQRQLQSAGLRDGEVEVTAEAIDEIVSGYTREPGVRGLERQLAKLLRKVATKIAADEIETPVIIKVEGVREYLGRRRFTFDAAERTSVPGVASGLAVTGAGGDVLFIEATTIPSKGDGHLQLTGQLGDVMKESAEIALSWVRSHASELGIEAERLQQNIHLHVPAGATPKDGPSAGVTMTTALVSLLTNRPARSTVAMTGEVTLRGRVLPIGGLKQKLLAAHRAGMTDVIIPARNEPDLDDVPETVREALNVHLASDVTEVLDWALEPARTVAAA